MAQPISSNHFSTDQQVIDAMDHLQLAEPAAYHKVLADFPEYANHVFDGAWFDTEAMGVDPEWSSWLVDAIENTALITWWEGEPWYGPWAEEEAPV